MSGKHPPFAMVPVHLIRRLDNEEITIFQLGLVAALTYREWRDGGGTTFTLVELKDWLSYELGTEQLRRELHALRFGTLTPPAPGKARWKWSSGGDAGGALGGDGGGGQLHPTSTEKTAEHAQTPMNGALPGTPTSTEAPPAQRPLEVEVEVEAAAEVDIYPQGLAVDGAARATAKPDESPPNSAAAEPTAEQQQRPASEQDIDLACRRFGAERNIVAPIAEGFTRADLTSVTETMDQRLKSGKVQDTPALFVHLIRAQDKERRRATVDTVAGGTAEQPWTIEEELETYEADLLRQGHPEKVVAELTDMRRRKLLRRLSRARDAPPSPPAPTQGASHD